MVDGLKWGHMLLNVEMTLLRLQTTFFLEKVWRQREYEKPMRFSDFEWISAFVRQKPGIVLSIFKIAYLIKFSLVFKYLNTKYNLKAW